MIRIRSAIAELVGGILLAAASFSASAQDFRDNFPPQYTDSPMGVNLQSGRFSYWLFSFAMGPFVTERGFGKSGFPYVGTIYWRTAQTWQGVPESRITVNLGNPAMSLGNPVELVQNSLRPVGNSWLRGASSSRIDFYLTSSWDYIWIGTTMGYRLARTGAGHTLTDKSGTQYYFADATSSGGYATPNGRLTTVTYADGSTIHLTYDASGRIKFMQSNRGYAVRYELIGTQLKICGFNLAETAANADTSCSASSRVVTINNTLRSDGLLQPTSVIDVMGRTTTITWGGYDNNFPVCITLPDSSTCEVTNSFGPQPGELEQLTKKDQVRVQIDASGATYTYGYDFPISTSDDPPKLPGGPPIQSTSWMNGPGYSAQGYYEDGLLKTLSAPGGGPTSFQYNGLTPMRATWPEGNNLYFDRDTVGNALTITDNPKPGSGQSAITRTQQFPVINLYGNPTLCAAASDRLCDKPIRQVDGKGYQTDYTYDPAHGGMLTKTLPADANSIRPQTRYEYQQRYAWIRTAGGSYTTAATPVWVKTRERFCRTTAASGQSCAGGAADEVITDFEYGPNSGPNNLLLRGIAVTADGQTLRTCYSYDAVGRKISETSPRAGLGVCP